MTKAEHSLLFGYPRTKALSVCALFAALLSISSLISIPIPFSPVPTTLQVMVVFLVAGILGPVLGALACTIYLGLGAISPFLLGAAPFLPVDAAKALVAVPIAMRARWLPINLPIIRASTVLKQREQ